MRALKWCALGNVLGLDTAYRLERISGRYGDLDRERAALPTVYALHPTEGVDVWQLLRSWHDRIPWVDALCGSAIYLPMADGADNEVSVSPTGLLARPLDAAARAAVGAWH